MGDYCFTPDVVNPVTAPAAARLVPPTYPPAPPGTAGAGDSEDRNAVASSLAEMLRLVFTPVASVREMLASLETVPVVEPLAATTRHAIGLMRDLAAGLLETAHRKIQPHSQRMLDTDLDLVKRELLRMSAHGIERALLDFRAMQNLGMSLGVFQEVARTEAAAEHRLPEDRYYYPLPGRLSVSHFGLMTRGDTVRAIIEDLRRSLMQDEALVSQHAFDVSIMQRLLALHHAAWRATPTLMRPPVSGASSDTPRELDPEERLIHGLRLRQQEP